MSTLEAVSLVVTLVSVGLLAAWKFARRPTRSTEPSPAVPTTRKVKAMLILSLASVLGIGLGVYVAMKGSVGGVRVNHSIVGVFLGIAVLGLSLFQRRS